MATALNLHFVTTLTEAIIGDFVSNTMKCWEIHPEASFKIFRMAFSGHMKIDANPGTLGSYISLCLIPAP